MPPTGRHAAPRDPARRRALLPTVLLAAGGCALGGLAVLPSGVRPGPATALAASAPADPSRLPTRLRPLAPPRTMSLTATVGPGPRRAQVQQVAESVALRRERASRARTARPPAAAPPAAAPPAAAPAPRAAPPRPSFVRPGVGALTSGYGPRWGRLHAGIDLASGTGSPVSAVADGTVLSAGVEGGYGQLVRVMHADGTVTLYAHLSAVLVAQGQRVRAGTHLGREGSSGHSTGPHLHFEVRVDGVPVDPAPWLRARGVNPERP